MHSVLRSKFPYLPGTTLTWTYIVFAVSGAWKGTNRIKIYNELGWESLDERRMFRRLTQFYKIMNNLTPEYLRIPVPPLHRHLHDSSQTKLLQKIFGQNGRYLKRFYPNTVNLWNDLSPSLRLAKSISVFKQNILKTYRPVKKSIFNIYEPKCIKWIFQLRVGLSFLRSHKKRHNFRDTPDDTCHCTGAVENTGAAETTTHFLLHCQYFIEHRRTLFESINPILEKNNLFRLVDKDIVHLLLYGNATFKLEENQTILKATINFIRKTSRFSKITDVL